MNRPIHFMNPLLPYVCVIRLTWLSETPQDPSQIRRADRFLRVMKRKIVLFRYLSSVSFIVYFILGPTLTYFRGIAFSLYYLIPAHVFIVISVVLAIKRDQRFWHLRLAQIAGIFVECAICPGYMVNITRRMSWSFVHLTVDGGMYALLRAAPDANERLKTDMRIVLEELSIEYEDDDLLNTRIKIYKKALIDKLCTTIS